MLKLKPRFPTFRPIPVERLEALRDLPLASFGRRAAAFVIDFGVVILICAGIQALRRMDDVRRAFAAPRGTPYMNFDVHPFHGWELIVLVLYFGLFTYLGHGRSPGKRLLRLRVVSLTHGHLSLMHSIDRALGYGVSVLEGGFGFFQYFFHPNRQTAHDRLAETIVVKEPKRPKPGDLMANEPRHSESPDQNPPEGL